MCGVVCIKVINIIIISISNHSQDINEKGVVAHTNSELCDIGNSSTLNPRSLLILMLTGLVTIEL